MGTLTPEELGKIRIQLAKYSAKNGIPINYVVAAVNAAAQTIEDELSAVQGQISAAIDAATQPHGITFTGAQKKAIGAHVFNAKYDRDKD